MKRERQIPMAIWVENGKVEERKGAIWDSFHFWFGSKVDGREEEKKKSSEQID